MKKAAVIVLNWNGWRDTVACVHSLQRLVYPSFEVKVVDNASTDGSEEQLRAAFPGLCILQSGANLGFAGGNNVGIKAALSEGADYVWLLNNDATADPLALSAMIDVAERDPRVGAVGSRIFFMDRPEELQTWGGGWADVWTGRSSEFRRRVPDEALDYVTGASLLLRREAIERTGMLDAGYFLYFEDTDLGFRLRRDGWRLAVAEESRVWHRGSATSSSVGRAVSRYRTQSLLRFLKLHSPAFPAAAAASTALRGTSWLLRGQLRQLQYLYQDSASWLWGELRAKRGA